VYNKWSNRLYFALKTKVKPMPHFVVRTPGQAEQAFSFQQDETVIGRGNDADLVLPNVSVSRHHARVLGEDHGVWRIEDLESRNGMMVNGESCKNHVLKTGDEVQVGKFLLVFLSDERQDQVYKGRFISYMTEYKVHNQLDGDSTFQIDKADMERLKAQTRVMRGAKVVAVLDSRKSWMPNDRELQFGSKAEVSVEGRFTGGHVATIRWEHGVHVLEKIGRFTKILVNDGPVKTTARLKHGDTLTVGTSRFRYETPKE
jgi:pSer/pThr/pTyr-binding forkhead associated (FHA) protein